MTTPTVTETRRHGQQIGERVELARYTISSGARVVLGQGVDGGVRVTDCPASGRGRSYLVERGLEQEGDGANAALKALIADYLTQAERYNDCPMRHTAVEDAQNHSAGGTKR
jgi:hypothetical protein